MSPISRRFQSDQPWYLWVNLLSLDAPAVALAWQDMFARSLHVPLGPVPRVVTAGCVWLAYAGDRLLDGSVISYDSLVTPRHRFARLYRQPLAVIWGLVLSIMTYCAFGLLRSELIHSGIVLSVLVVAYFAVVHWPGRRTRLPAFKEGCVAALFSVGSVTFVMAKMGHVTLALVPPVLFWLSLCFLNCAGIGCWEKNRDAVQRQESLALQTPGFSRHFASVALWVAAAAVVAGLLPFSEGIRPVYFSVAASSLMLAALDRFRSVFEIDALRVGADLALLTPLLLRVL